MFTENINIRLAQTELDCIFFGGSITPICSSVIDNYERDRDAKWARQDRMFKIQFRAIYAAMVIALIISIFH